MSKDEGFPVYFTSRGAFEATWFALKDELVRANDNHNTWRNRWQRANIGVWQAQCDKEMQKAAQQVKNLTQALADLESESLAYSEGPPYDAATATGMYDYD